MAQKKKKKSGNASGTLRKHTLVNYRRKTRSADEGTSNHKGTGKGSTGEAATKKEGTGGTREVHESAGPYIRIKDYKSPTPLHGRGDTTPAVV